jgi:hypothetical protein
MGRGKSRNILSFLFIGGLAGAKERIYYLKYAYSIFFNITTQ